MALFPQVNVQNGGLDDRTHTNLVRSEGNAPAEYWIVDPDLPGLFEYRFGGFGMVVIPKGKIVAVSDPKYDWQTDKITTCLTIANGVNMPIGVAQYNIFEKKRDRFDGNFPSVITREYIEVPFIVGDESAAAMKWGCATADTATGLKPGDYVKPNAAGQFVKWTEGTDNFSQLVGQVYAMDTDLPPLGWLAYFMNVEVMQNELNDGIINASYPPATKGGYPGSANFAALVKQLFDANNPTGIKYLTDGYFRSKTTYGGDTPEIITAHTSVVASSAGVNINAGTGALTVPADGEELQLVLKANAPIAADETIRIYFGDDVVTEGRKYHIDHRLNQITLYLDENDNNKVVKITYTQIVDQIPGIPTEWDYKGSVGAARILLMK